MRVPRSSAVTVTSSAIQSVTRVSAKTKTRSKNSSSGVTAARSPTASTRARRGVAMRACCQPPRDRTRPASQDGRARRLAALAPCKKADASAARCRCCRPGTHGSPGGQFRPSLTVRRRSGCGRGTVLGPRGLQRRHFSLRTLLRWHAHICRPPQDLSINIEMLISVATMVPISCNRMRVSRPVPAPTSSTFSLSGQISLAGKLRCYWVVAPGHFGFVLRRVRAKCTSIAQVGLHRLELYLEVQISPLYFEAEPSESLSCLSGGPYG